MNKFTPGKWDVSAKRKNLVIGPRGHALADCKFSHSATNRQLPTASECIANARLIAAAPELLAAVEGLLNALPSATTHPAIQAARAAIAKATEPQS
ncbi:MAG: hypothetical protein IRZ07_00695 [Microbispora sp.]|nr:hypothetical protein [Microbispora sp.]